VLYLSVNILANLTSPLIQSVPAYGLDYWDSVTERGFFSSPSSQDQLNVCSVVCPGMKHPEVEAGYSSTSIADVRCIWNFASVHSFIRVGRPNILGQ
jgi:hypothetical protein